MGPEDNPDFDCGYEDGYIEYHARQAFPLNSLVSYEITQGGSETASGYVASEPWKLGNGTWVVKLRDMDANYAHVTGKAGDKATTVFAADLSRLTRLHP